MKKFKGVIAAVLAVTMMFSLTACGKKVKRIDDNAIEDAFDVVFGWDDDEYYEFEDYEQWGTNFDDPDDPHIYELDEYISGSEWDDDEYIHITFCDFDEVDEADEYFGEYYGAFGDDTKKNSYKEGRWGYYIEYDEKDRFAAMYFCDDMVLEVTGVGKDNVKLVKQFLKELGLPR